MNTKAIPLYVLKLILLWCLAGYLYTTVVSADIGLVTYYHNLEPVTGQYISAILPIGFIVGIVVLIGGWAINPTLAMKIALVPQIAYTALSANWFLGLYPDLSPAALFTHTTVSMIFAYLIWREEAIYVANHPRTD